MGPTSFLRDVILLAVIAQGVLGGSIDFRISASTIEPFDDLPPDFEAATETSEASKSQEMFDNSEDITLFSTIEPEIAQVAEFAVPRPSLMDVEELLKRGEIKLDDTTVSGDEESEEEKKEVVKISGDVTTTQTPPSTTASTTTTTSTTVAPTTTVTSTTTAAPTTTSTTTVPPTTTVSTTTTQKPTTVVSTTTTTAKPTPSTTLPERDLKIDFRGIPRELLTSEEIEEQERQEDEELQKALKLLPERQIEKKKLQEETFFAFSEGEETETVEKAESVPKDEAAPKVVETSKTVLSLNKIDDEEEQKKEEKVEKVEDVDMISRVVAPEVVELRMKAHTTTTMVPANLFARNMPQNFEQFTFQVGRNFVPRTIFQKPKDGVSALIDMAIPQLSHTTVTPSTASPLIGKQMFEIDVPARVPTTTAAPATSTTTTPTTTTTTAATTAEPETTTPDFKFPFVVPDRIKSEDKKKSIEESLKEIKDAFKRIRQLVKEDGKEDGSEITSASAEDIEIPLPPTDPTTVSTTVTPRTTTAAPTTVPSTTRSTTTTTTATTTVPTTTTTTVAARLMESSSSEELIKAGDRPSWLDLSVFADNHRGLTTTTTASASTTSATTTTEEPTTTPTEPPPKEAIVMQGFALSEKKKDEIKEAQEKKLKERESEFGGNIFDEIAEREDPDRFSTPPPPPAPKRTRTFVPPPVPPLPTADAFEAVVGASNQVTRRPRDQSAPPKAPSLQQERLPKAFRALVEDLEIEAETERERVKLLEQLRQEESQLKEQLRQKSRAKSTRPAPSITATPFLDGAITNEVEMFFEDSKDTAEEKIRKSGRVHRQNSTVVGHRRRIIKGRRKLNQNSTDVLKHSRIVRTQKRLVLVPEEEEIDKWVASQERGSQSKLPQAEQPPLKGTGRTTPPPAFSIGDPAKMRTTPGPIKAISITSRPYFNVNSRMQVQQLQPQPDGSMAVRTFLPEELSDGPLPVKPQIKERRAIVEPHRSSHSSHTGSSDPQSARARDYDMAMHRIASQIADKMFPTTKPPQQVQPIRPVPLSPPRHTIRIGKKAPPAVPLVVKRTVDSGRISVDSAGVNVDPKTVRVRNRRNKHVVGISKRRRHTQGAAGAAEGRRLLTVVHADPSLPAGAIEVPGLLRGERAVHEGERPRLGTRSAIQPPVLHPLVIDRNYDRQTIDRDIRL